jgi:putative ATP-binding cassette transporter
MFNTVKLSAGQRKRLALAVALLERRPILVLDEWAAEQDPLFRRTFYEEIVPWLRAGGRTVVAVSHDDRYFGAADRCLLLEGGRFREWKP